MPGGQLLSKNVKGPVYRILALCLLAFVGCKNDSSSNREMASRLAALAREVFSPRNDYSANAKLAFYDSSLKVTMDDADAVGLQYLRIEALLEAGKEKQAITACDELLQKIRPDDRANRLVLMKHLAIAQLRLGERTNCVMNHSGESCIFPIAGRGVHIDKSGSQSAIDLYQSVLEMDPKDLESRWLLNIAYMTIGGYPGSVPPAYLIKGLDSDTLKSIRPFTDAAINIGLNINNLAGGAIVDDFSGDGYLDVVTSSWSLTEGMHYCRNNQDGTFTDISDSSGLSVFTGGLNMMQTDFNNDGWKDIFVLRGGWMGEFGRQPNSLLRNNGNGTFTDVTKEAGLYTFRPTQTATWADFNNDGWLDVFIGNESSSSKRPYPCELYINNKNGTFTEIATRAGCDITAFVKGVTSGDIDNDGFADIFLSTLGGQKILLRNNGLANNQISFTDISVSAGLSKNQSRTFPTWFWDYDNDGWLDILVAGFSNDNSLSSYSAEEALGINTGDAGKLVLFRNNQRGGFDDVTAKVGLNKVVFAMGSNFGDIDNDGYLDIYMGTGNPVYQSLIPNKMFKNRGGIDFQDITTAARVGNLQKGHAVSFADLDNDGDLDIYEEMGGAYDGDGYQNSLFINPGQNDNRWVALQLEGVNSNRLAIGAKIKVVFEDAGRERLVYREVNSGGSFGSNPLLQHIGVGQATIVKSIEIRWPSSKDVSVFNNVRPGQTILIREGDKNLTTFQYSKVDFTVQHSGIIPCSPR